MNEQGIIERFRRPFARLGADVVLGPGDDAAILRPRSGFELVATTDAVLEGVHFSRAFAPSDIGHKALAVNLSDLAAMGAQPRWFLVALELPRGLSPSMLDGIARGMAALARPHGCTLVGGNVVAGSKLALTITALGEVRVGSALRRDGLKPGDLVAVTGSLGAAAAGLRRLRRGERRGAARQLRPEPRVAAGLAAIGVAHAAIDVSDGLARDVERLAVASRVRIDLRSADLPVAPGATLALALSGGEDYELVFGVAPSKFEPLKSKLARAAASLTAIGTVRRGLGLYVDGKQVRGAGFDHFGSA